jgi:hypothetical protein
LARFVLVYRLFNLDYDITWQVWEVWIWTVVGIYVAIFAASAPALKPVFKLVATRLARSTLRGSRQPDSSDTAAEVEDVEAHGKVNLNYPADGPPVDLEMIGVAYGGEDEKGFWKDLGSRASRRIRSMSSRGSQVRLAPLSVSGASVPADYHSRTAEVQASPVSASPRSPHWPFVPEKGRSMLSPAQRSRPFIPSQGSQQTIHVGLQIELEHHELALAVGSVKRARLRAESLSSHGSRSLREATSTTTMNEKQAGPESLRSPSPDWTTLFKQGTETQTANLLASRAATATTTSALAASSPISPSRDFDPERRHFSHGRRDGFMM